jgi:hypothetical protein
MDNVAAFFDCARMMGRVTGMRRRMTMPIRQVNGLG